MTVNQSAEQVAALPSGISIAYDTFGDPADPAILLIMGLSGPLTWWEPEFCDLLAAHGFYVIRYDNRDIGRSTVLTTARVRRSALVRGYVRRTTAVPYTMSDLAHDAVGLLDHLHIEQAHICGISMGGMIAQTIAIEHADRVVSLISIMSTTGRRSVGWQDPRLLPQLVVNRSRSKEDYVASSARTWRFIGSPDYPIETSVSRERAADTYDRGVTAPGVFRQMLAVVTQPDRTVALGRVRVPTLVIHGLNDRMVHVSGGRATARAVPGAELLLIPGMGHDLPEALWPTIVDAIARTARSATSRTESTRSTR
jgi:pimeloyl-ACP methyl ester carboxylesterase